MPEWLLWILFVVVLLPVAALCLMLIYALTISAHLKISCQTRESFIENH
ncbi:MAG: hypothetical protein ACYDB0_00980 [Acidithiobacillus sp.]